MKSPASVATIRPMATTNTMPPRPIDTILINLDRRSLFLIWDDCPRERMRPVNEPDSSIGASGFALVGNPVAPP